MRLLRDILIIASIAALAALAFPISAVSAFHKEPKLIFEIDPSLREPKVLYIAGPLSVDLHKPKPAAKSSQTKATGSVKKQKVTGFNPCNCWAYVHYIRGNNMPLGYRLAGNYPTNSRTPQIGAIIVTHEGKVGHMGIVRSFNEDSVTFEEYNYVHCGHSIRTLKLNSSLIKGFIL